MIKISNLNKYFYRKKNNEIHVINDVTLEFPNTGLVTIIGESGSGKTTLMNVIGGLDDFYSGTVEIDNYKITKYNASKVDRIRNEKIGYIFQNYLLLPQRTVYENLKIVLNMYDITSKEIDERIDYVLEAVGMLKYKKKNVTELSGGQQQRIAIARALIKSPSVILADEPTGNLDEKNTIQIMNIIKKISEKTLVILVSHEKKIAESYSDYIITVCDGKVVNNHNYSDNITYSYEDDQNLYLKEYEYSKIESEQVNIDFYSNQKEKINLQIVFENGKFYIKSNNDVILLDDTSEVKLLDENKKELDINIDVEDSDFELSPLKFIKTPRLSFKEQIKLARNNLNKAKKKTLFLSIPLFIIIIFVLLCIQSVITESYIDRQNIVYSDSRIYNLLFEKQEVSINTEVKKFGLGKFYEGFHKENPNIEPILDCSITFEFTLPDFSQLNSTKYKFEHFSVLSLELVKEEDLIYGRMPEKATEIVVEKWVLENAIKDSTLNNFMNPYSFLNKEITFTDRRDYNFTIVGISSNDENTIYMNKWAIFDVYPSDIKKTGISVCSMSEANKYIDVPLNKEIGLYQGYVNKNCRRYLKGTQFKVNDDKELTIDVVDDIDVGDCPYDLILADEIYDKVLISVLKYNSERLDLFCETKEERKQVDNYINSVKDYFLSGELKATEENGYTGSYTDSRDVKLSIESKSKYDNLLQPTIDEANKVVTSRILVTVTIIILSIIIVYFSMKSFAIRNIYDIGVFRAIGIKKGSITLIYAIETLIISLKSTLIGGLLCFIVTNIIAGIPSMNPEGAISFVTFSIATFGLIVVNIIAGILPVIICMIKTPSQILSKYDI